MTNHRNISVCSKHFIRLLCTAASMTLLLDIPGAAQDQTQRTSSEDRAAKAAYLRQPLSFEPNQGQADSRVKFISRGRGYTLFLTSTDAVLSLRKPKSLRDLGGPPQRSANPQVLDSSDGSEMHDALPRGVAVRMHLACSSSASKISPLDELPGKSNYFVGRDPLKWHTNVPTFGRVHYQNVYRGVDLVYHGNQQELEYDFVVAPGADLKKIIVNIDSGPESSEEKSQATSKLRIDQNGDLVFPTAEGELLYLKPVAYQASSIGAEAREFLEAHYVLKGSGQIGFEVAPYDKARPLVIDPVLTYSTFVAGSSNDLALAIAVDSSGAAYITGSTNSTDFPITMGALDTGCGTDGNCNGSLQNTDVFVTKLNSTGSALVYSTYLGGSFDEQGQAIAVDASGNAYVTGYTRSYDFPVTVGAAQTTCGPYVASNFVTCASSTGSNCAGAPSVEGFSTGSLVDVFVTKLNPSGSALVYSTFLGGTGNDNASGIAVNAAGQAYVAGSTDSQQQEGYVRNGACPSTSGYSTSYPTTSSGFMAAPPISATPAGSPFPSFQPSAVFSKLSADGKSLLYSTYFGSGGPALHNGANAVAVDSSDKAYVVGFTNSATFPTTSGVFQQTVAGPNPNSACGSQSPCRDAFVAKFDPSMSGAGSLVYSTLLGGSGEDAALGVTVDSAGNAYVTGNAGFNSAPSSDFPTTLGAFQTSCPSSCLGDKLFVTKLNPTATGLVYSTFLGGNGGDDENSNPIALDSSGRAYIAGGTSSSNFPTANAIQSSLPGVASAFVTLLNASGSGVDFSTYFGGTQAQAVATGVALDGSDNIYVVGYTGDPSFPTTSGAFQTTCTKCSNPNNRGNAGFVFKISLQLTATTTTIISSANPSVFGQSVMFTATVKASGSGTPSGTVTFMDGATTLGTGALNGSAQATFTTTALTAGSHSITAVYGGDANFAGSTSSALSQVVSDFSIAVAPSSRTVKAGKSTTYTLTLTPVRGFTGTISLSCSATPPAGTCSVSPASVTLNGTSSSTATVTVTTAPGKKGTPKGTYTLTFTGAFGTLQHSSTANLVVD